jgi:ubiquitin carboxyl-terminal hydrolase 47
VKLYKVDLDEDTVTASVVMRAFPAQTVGEFKDAVAEVLGLGPGVRARCVLEKYASDLRPLLLDERTLKTEGFYKSNKVSD